MSSARNIGLENPCIGANMKKKIHFVKMTLDRMIIFVVSTKIMTKYTNHY